MKNINLTGCVPVRINKTLLKLTAFLVLTLLVIASATGSRVIGFGPVVAIIIILFHSRIHAFRRGVYYGYLLFLVIPVIGTINSFVFFDETPDVWQMARTQIWTLIIPILVYGAYRTAIQASDEFLKSLNYFVILYIVWGSILLLLEHLTAIPASPAYIRPSYEGELGGDNRIYIFGLQLIAPFLPIFVAERRWLAGAACLIIIYSTGGKLAIVPLLSLFVFLILSKKFSISNKVVVLVLSLISMIVLMLFIGERVLLVAESGDQRRFMQLQDAMEKISRDDLTLMFGAGFGTIFTEGYFITFNSAIDDITPILVNSQYDIESGYGYLVLRFGALGLLMFFFLINFQIGPYRTYFIIYWMAMFIGFAPAGPMAAFEFAVFGYCAAYYERYHSVFSQVGKSPKSSILGAQV